VVGDVTLDQVKKMADQYMASIPARGLPPKIRTVEPVQNGERRVTTYKDVATPNILMAYHVPETRHADFYALDLLSSLLTSGNSSRLTKSLVMDSTLATNVSSFTDQSFDPSLFIIYAIAGSNVTAPDLEKAINSQIEMVIKDGVKEEELQKVKNKKLIEFYHTLETINGKANSLGSYEVFFGDYKKMFEAPELYKKVTGDDIKRVAAQYLTERNRTVGYLLPEKSK